MKSSFSNVFLSIIVISLLFFLIQCGINEDTIGPPPVTTGLKIHFSLGDVEEKAVPKSLNSNSIFASQPMGAISGTPTTILYTITDVEGTDIITNAEIDLTDFSGDYVSLPIGLVSNHYILAKLIVYDQDGNAIFAAPKSGSPLAFAVDEPLDLDVFLPHDSLVNVTVQVLPVLQSSPGEFGYSSFGVEHVPSFYFTILPQVYDESTFTIVPTEAHLEVSTDSGVLFSGNLPAQLSYILIPHVDVDAYTLTITKIGDSNYDTIRLALTHHELVSYCDRGLKVTFVHRDHVNYVVSSTYVSQMNPNIAIGTATPDLFITSWRYTDSLGIQREKRRTLLELDLSLVNPNEVVSATLSLRGSDVESYLPINSLSPFYIYKTTGTWSISTVTWANQPNVSSLGRVSYSPIDLSGVYEIDVTNLILNMLNDDVSFDGLMINFVSERSYKSTVFASSTHYNVSLRPKLTIEFTN